MLQVSAPTPGGYLTQPSAGGCHRDVTPETSPPARGNHGNCNRPARDNSVNARSVSDSALSLRYNPAVTTSCREQEKAAQIDAGTGAEAPAGGARRADDSRLSLRSDERPDPAAHPAPETAAQGAAGALPHGLTYRVFKNFYLCDACPLEWEETAICAGPAWCPCCDAETPAYDSIDLLEDA